MDNILNNSNFILDSNYKYEIINETVFNNKYLMCKTDGSKYKKYLLVCYKDNNEIKYIEIPNEDYLSKFNNIIKIYELEEIISSCINFDSYYNKANYFHVDDIYFIKYLMDEDNYKQFKSGNDYEKIKDFFNQ